MSLCLSELSIAHILFILILCQSEHSILTMLFLLRLSNHQNTLYLSDSH